MCGSSFRYQSLSACMRAGSDSGRGAVSFTPTFGPELGRDGIHHRDVERVIVLRKEMIAGLGQAVARRGASGPTAVIRPRDSSLEPAFALQLEKLLSNCLAGQLQLLSELCNGRRPLPLQRDENRTTA